MRVAFLIPVFPEIHNTFILNQITGLIDLGHEVDLYPLATGDYLRAHSDVAAYKLKERVRHLEIPASHARRLRLVAGSMLRGSAWRRSVLASLDPFGGRRTLSLVPAITALSFAKERRYDVIHAQFGNLGDAALAVAGSWGRRVPVVTSFRGADTTSKLVREPHAYDKLFREGALFLPVSRDLRRRLLEHGAPPARTHVHHSGTPLERFKKRDYTGASPGRLRTLFIGRFVEKKGVEYALDAVAALTARQTPFGGGVREVSLTLVGSGPLEPVLRERVLALGLDERVTFAGQQDQAGVLGWLARSDALVAPSVTGGDGQMEGIPNVAKEAMACGLPVVSTFHGGIPELIDDGVCGFLVPERDALALAEKLARLADDPDLRARMGAAGRAKVEAEFDSQRLNRELAEHYAALVR